MIYRQIKMEVRIPVVLHLTVKTADIDDPDWEIDGVNIDPFQSITPRDVSEAMDSDDFEQLDKLANETKS